MILKLAGWNDIIKAVGAGAGKLMASSNVVRNAAIGTGVGAAVGAINANPGERMSGALKGAATGGAIAGIGTYGKNVLTTAKTFAPTIVGKTMTQGAVLKAGVQEANAGLKNAWNGAVSSFNKQKALVPLS